jgi:sensor histidine kinase YesM
VKKNKMDISKQLKDKRDIKIGIHVVLVGVVGAVFFILVQMLVNALHIHNDEAVSFALTISFLASIYLGRFIATYWIPSGKKTYVSLLVIIPIFMLVFLFLGIIFGTYTEEKAVKIFFSLLSAFLFSVLLGLIIKLVRINISNQLQVAQTMAANSKSELRLLQSQLSPHFLFNTLNNLYGLSLSQHEKIPPLLLKLSELLRYSVYEANEIFVPIKDEITYIKNYIEFEKIRIGERLVLKTEFEEITNSDIKIAPMLLIVFIENAFKHSKNTADLEIFIDISVKIWGNTILFSVKNSHHKSNSEKMASTGSPTMDSTGSSTMDKNSGFGLANVQKRLELLYPNNHILEVQNEEENYRVMLQLKVK